MRTYKQVRLATFLNFCVFFYFSPPPHCPDQQRTKEKFILYVLLSLGCGVVAFLAVLSARLYAQGRREEPHEPETKLSEPLSGSFDDCDGGGVGVDQVDTSTGCSATRHAHTIEVVRYANRPGISRHDSDTYPRAPVTRSTTSYYYS
ncbi:hypothetical protein MRX96_053018 [Rhipicephalus microplus]